MDEFVLRRTQSQAKNSQNMLDAKKAHNESRAKTEMVLEEIKQKHEQIQSVLNDTNVLAKIHTQFKDETKLNEKDIAFLFGATALQMLRWILLPKLDFDFKPTSSTDRMTAKQGGQFEIKGVREYLEKKGYSASEIKELSEQGHINKYTWEKLLIAPVPYDAMIGSEKIVIDGVSGFGKNINGINHHSATWGHDPIVGWVIGPMNITSRMITFRDFSTYHVAQIGYTKKQYITRKASMGKMLNKSINAWKNESKKFFVSVAKQGMHLKSDKYTKLGLPIPFLSPKALLMALPSTMATSSIV